MVINQEEHRVEPGPIFIGGPDRCGKTTLRAFLVSHPRISIPAVGSNMWTYFYGQYGDLSQKNNFERCLQAMIRYKHVHFLKPDPERIRREFWQGTPTYARLFALFHQHHSEREGKPRWGDQTGLIERYADHVFAAHPTARMIHMLRDPRDRYQASLALWPDGKGRAGGATARWLYSESLARRNQRRYPQGYKIVRFEMLIREPEQTLRQVCKFLNEEYVPTMLSMDGALDRREKLCQGRNIEPDASPLSEEFIGLYREAIPKREIAFMQWFAGKRMAALGYLPDPIPFSPMERLYYAAFDWPLNLARMAAWFSIETIQHHMPAWFGRQPSSSMIIKESTNPILVAD
jgi:hypothetical protein